jgi:hypothetical protein
MSDPEQHADASQAAFARRGIRWDATAAIIASLVGLLALLVAGYTAYIQRQQVRAQVWPYLQMGKNNAEGQYELIAVNSGVGPVIVRSVQVLVAGKPVESWHALEHLMGFKPADEVVMSTLNQRVLAPADRIHWIRFTTAMDINTFVSGWQKLHTEARVCYSSTLGESWMLTCRPDSGTSHRAVSRCPKLPVAMQFDG